MIPEEQFPPDHDVNLDAINLFLGLDGNELCPEEKRAAIADYPWPDRVHMNDHRSLTCIRKMRLALIAKGLEVNEMENQPVYFTLYLRVDADKDFPHNEDVTEGVYHVLLRTTIANAMGSKTPTESTPIGGRRFHCSGLEDWLGKVSCTEASLLYNQPIPRRPQAAPVELTSSGIECSGAVKRARKKYNTVGTAFDSSLSDTVRVMESTLSTQLVDGVRVGPCRDDVRAGFTEIRAIAERMVHKK